MQCWGVQMVGVEWCDVPGFDPVKVGARSELFKFGLARVRIS